MKYRVKTKEGTLRLVGLNLLITPHPAKAELSPEQAQMLMDDYGVEVVPAEEPETAAGEALEAEVITEGMPEAIEPLESEAGDAEPESVEPPEEEMESEAESADSAPKSRRKK